MQHEFSEHQWMKQEVARGETFELEDRWGAERAHVIATLAVAQMKRLHTVRPPWVQGQVQFRTFWEGTRVGLGVMATTQLDKNYWLYRHRRGTKLNAEFYIYCRVNMRSNPFQVSIGPIVSVKTLAMKFKRRVDPDEQQVVTMFRGLGSRDMLDPRMTSGMLKGCDCWECQGGFRLRTGRTAA